METSNNTRAPFFSLLDFPDTIYHPYQPTFLEKIHRNSVDSWYYPFFKHLKPITYGLTCLGISLGGLGNSWSIFGGILLGASAYLGMKLPLHTKIQKQILFEKKVALLRPSRTDHPIFKTKKETFNQVFSFVLDNENNIWYAVRDKKTLPNWKPVFIEDFPPAGEIDVELQSDGENLVVKTSERHSQEMATLFYKKVYNEHRNAHSYIIYNLAESPHSINQWFTLPIISWFTPQYWNQKLKIRSNSRWGLSHSGKLRFHIQDRKNQWHPIWGVTTIVEQIDQDLILYDPYWPPGFEIKVSLPPNFLVIDFATTSSKIFLMGRSYAGEWLLYESSLDYDILGLNPLMHYSWDISQKNARLLPLANWECTKISLQNLTGKINAMQFGMDKNTQLALEWRSAGSHGVYFKNLLDADWGSYTFEGVEEQSWYSLNSLSKHPLFSENVDFFGKKFTQCTIPHFDKNCLNAQLTFINKEERVIFNLQRTASIVQTFLKGKPNYDWILSLDPEFQSEKNKKWLGNALWFSVQIKHKVDFTQIDCGDKFSLRLQSDKRDKILFFSDYKDKSAKHPINQQKTKFDDISKQKISL